MVVVHIPEAYSQLQYVSPKVLHDITLMVGCEPLELNQVSLAYETSGLPSSSAASVFLFINLALNTLVSTDVISHSTISPTKSL
jgi:hypothetical protein